MNYEVWLNDQLGNRINILTGWSKLSWSRRANDLGYVELVFPEDKINFNYVWSPDRQIEVFRYIGDKGLNRIRTYFLRRARFIDSNGENLIVLSGPDSNDLLRRRIVAYAAGSSGAEKTGAADDIIKEYVYENLGAGAIAARDLTNYGFTIEGDSSDAPSITKAAAWQKLITTLQAISKMSLEKGTPLYFDVHKTSSGAYRFATYTNFLGRDKSDLPYHLILSDKLHSFVDAELDLDYYNEYTYAYGGGQGLEAEREIVETSTTNSSIFGRQEMFYDGRRYNSTAGLTDATEAALYKSRSKETFMATLEDGPNTQYGVHWEFGDLLNIAFRNRALEVVVEGVMGVVEKSGKETVSARLVYNG